MSTVLDFQCSSVNPSKVGGVGAAAKYFPRPLGASLTSGQPSTPSASNATGALWLPTGPQFDGAQFTVKATGTFGSDTGDPSGTVTINLYAVVGSISSPNYSTVLASTGAITPGFAAAESWSITASLLGDSVSGILGGSYFATAEGALVNSTPKSTDAIVLGLDFIKGNPALKQGAVLGFVMGVTFGTSDASNTASLTQFQIHD